VHIADGVFCHKSMLLDKSAFCIRLKIIARKRFER
jgi:hypothetical protein